MTKIIVGSEEWCSFPTLNIPAVKARVDSGAKTSSLHAFNIETFNREGKLWVRFEVHPIQKERKVAVHCEAQVVDRRSVKSSSGMSEKRYVIRTLLTLGTESWEVEVTLTNRDSMGYRMLLGRQAMEGRLLVDPSETLCLGEIPDAKLKKLYKKSVVQPSGLKIALLASNPALYSNQRIMEAGEERGHEMVFLNIKNCYIKLDSTSPEVHYRGGSVLKDLDAVIPRIRPKITFYGCAVLRQFESLGVFCLNSAQSITRSRDKLFALQLLVDKGLDIPTTGFANSPQDTDDLIAMVGGSPLVVKLLEGTQGKGVVLAETKKASESVINAFKSLQANILVQEFIKEANGSDLRCFVIDGKVVASIQRQAAPGEFRANIHQGGSASVVKITKEERKVALDATKCMKMKVAGVDILRSSNGPLLLEINSSPGLEGIESTTGKDIASLMISAIERQLNWKRECTL